jgi:hypothetical protein
MARYLLVRVEDNKRAEALIPRLDGVEGVKTVGKFAIPVDFCEGQCQKKERGKESSGNQISKLSQKLGWRYCPVCRKAKRTEHQLRNLLDPEGLPARFSDCWIRVKEPFTNEPEKVYGAELIKQYKAGAALVWEKIERSRRSRVRKQARRVGTE